MLEDKTKKYIFEYREHRYTFKNIIVQMKGHKGVMLYSNKENIEIGRKHYFAAEGAQGGGVGG